MSGRPVTLADFIGEHMLLLGAGSTVMYQLAMKGVGLGVAEHSTTLARPVDRLRTTLTYVYVMVLGSAEEKAEIARLVNRMHAGVRSPGRYSAYDTDLQLWVAATLAHNGEWFYERVLGPLDAASREQIYRDSWIFGTALQVTADDWPQTRAAFDDYWADALTRLEPDPIVQDYCRRLLSGEDSPLVARPVLALQSLMTRGNLEPQVREVLALPWSPREQRLYDLFWRVFPRVYRLVPRPLRQLHTTLILRDLRRRLRTGKRVI